MFRCDWKDKIITWLVFGYLGACIYHPGNDDCRQSSPHDSLIRVHTLMKNNELHY